MKPQREKGQAGTTWPLCIRYVYFGQIVSKNDILVRILTQLNSTELHVLVAKISASYWGRAL
jgi:hypothetical protein